MTQVEIFYRLYTGALPTILPPLRSEQPCLPLFSPIGSHYYPFARLLMPFIDPAAVLLCWGVYLHIATDPHRGDWDNPAAVLGDELLIDRLVAPASVIRQFYDFFGDPNNVAVASNHLTLGCSGADDMDPHTWFAFKSLILTGVAVSAVAVSAVAVSAVAAGNMSILEQVRLDSTFSSYTLPPHMLRSVPRPAVGVN